MSNHSEFLWYIPMTSTAVIEETSRPTITTASTPLTAEERAIEMQGWKGALIAVRPRYWKPANFASSAATLERPVHNSPHEW